MKRPKGFRNLGALPFTFTPFAMAYYDAMDELKGSEIKCLLVIVRETWGRHNPETGERGGKTQIPIGRFCDKTGVDERQVIRCLAALSAKGFITISGSKRNHRFYLANGKIQSDKNVTMAISNVS